MLRFHRNPTSKHQETMIHEEVTLAGKPVALGYCYATEIAYKKFTDENISGIIQETIEAVNAQPPRIPDTERSIYLVLAAIMAYYDSKDEDAPIKDTGLMRETSPLELGMALGTIITMWSQFYSIPKGEPEEKPSKGKDRKKN
jgi:hypothetical protein